MDWMKWVRPEAEAKDTAGGIMSQPVHTAGPNDPLTVAAQIMWEKNCGFVPVVDERRRLLGVVTDRDVAMGAYTQGLPLSQIPVSRVMAAAVESVEQDVPVARILELLTARRIRRLPVVDGAARVVGVVSLADLVRWAHGERVPGQRMYRLLRLGAVLQAVSQAESSSSQVGPHGRLWGSYTEVVGKVRQVMGLPGSTLSSGSSNR